MELIFDDDRLLDPGRSIQLESNGKWRVLEIEFFRRQHGRFVLKLKGIDTIEDAEKIVGADLRIPKADLPAAEKGSFYTFELRGCRVYAMQEGRGEGEYIGKVADVVDGGGTQLLQVGSGKEETLIPFAESIVKKIDLAAQRIEVELPEGLRDLNR